MKKYIVKLTQKEKQSLKELVKKGKVAAYKIKHANILLKADIEGGCWTDNHISEAFSCHNRTVENVRRRFVLEGLEVALEKKKPENPPRQRKLDGRGEARLIALACGPSPTGQDRWTLQLLADELVRLKIVDSISDQTVRRTLKKMNYAHISNNIG